MIIKMIDLDDRRASRVFSVGSLIFFVIECRLSGKIVMLVDLYEEITNGQTLRVFIKENLGFNNIFYCRFLSISNALLLLKELYGNFFYKNED